MDHGRRGYERFGAAYASNYAAVDAPAAAQAHGQ
jgi:hypothetical protein